MSKLIKPCPFCGAEGILTDVSNMDGEGWQVICKNCKAATTIGNVTTWEEGKNGGWVNIGRQNKKESIEVAINNWNYRP